MIKEYGELDRWIWARLSVAPIYMHAAGYILLRMRDALGRHVGVTPTRMTFAGKRLKDLNTDWGSCYE